MFEKLPRGSEDKRAGEGERQTVKSTKAPPLHHVWPMYKYSKRGVKRAKYVQATQL